MRSPFIARITLAAVAGLAACKDPPPPNVPGSARGYTIEPTVYGEGAEMSADVKAACGFDGLLTQSVTDEIAERGTGERTGEGKTLKLTIARVQGAEPDWEGDVRILVDGALHSPGGDDGDEKHEFSAHGHAPAGLGSGMRGVCRGLDEIAGELAVHIVDWMAAPRHDADIGSVNRIK